MSIARQLLDELRRDEELRREFIEEIAAELLKDRRVRIAVLKALRRDIATKQDVEKLQEYIDRRITELRNEVREEIRGLKQEEIGGVREDIKGLNEEVRKLRSRIWWLVAILFSMWITIVLTILFRA